MKKKLVIAIIAIVCVIGAVVGILMATIKHTTSVSISIEGYSADNPPTIKVGEFPYENYSIKVSRSSGSDETLALTEEMFADGELLKLYQEGEQTLTIKYGGATCEIKVIIQRKSLDDLTFSDKTVVYTGEEIVMEIDGVLPADATVRYPDGNSFVDAGEYDVLAVIYGDVYETKTLTAHLTVEKAAYDMSGVSFENATYTYDGESKSLALKGTLPSGVRVAYSIGEKTGNSAVEAGIYTVVAKFTSSNANYSAIDDMTGVLTIEKASYDVSSLSMQNKAETYDGKEYSLTLDNESLVPRGVSIFYQIRKVKTGGGEEIEDSVFSEGNGATNAGTYEVQAVFILSDAQNYNTIAPIVATLTIEQAEYVLDVHFYNATFTYDGQAHSLSLMGENPSTAASLPAGMSVEYTVQKIYNADGTAVEEEVKSGNGATELGTYKVVAYFSHSNDNYKAVSSIDGLFVIEVAETEEEGEDNA